MALNLPNNGDSILEYDIEQTNEINKMTDYVTSRTSVGAWEVEEWASGWVVQTRRFEVTLTFTPILGTNRAVWDRADVLPISYNPSRKIYTSLENMYPTAGGSTMWSARNNSDYGRFLGGIFLSLSAGDLAVNAVFTIKGYRA